jgi:peptidoglycan/LPS O-acetylase OafA/YrhL
MNEKAAYAVAIVGGALLWLGTSALTGEREAWDSSSYWTIAYPLSVALAGVLGYLAPAKPKHWGLAVMLAQAVALAFANSDFGLLPLGLIMFAVLSLPAVALAWIAARIRRKGV